MNTRDSYNEELKEGFIGTSDIGLNEMGWEAPVWHALPVVYDQCMGNCDCIPDRDIPEVMFTVHFSCIQGLNKPGHYTSEKQFAEDMMAKAPSCSRRWMWHVWYMGHYVKAHGRYDPPLWDGPPIPGYDEALDAKLKANRLLIR